MYNNSSRVSIYAVSRLSGKMEETQVGAQANGDPYILFVWRQESRIMIMLTTIAVASLVRSKICFLVAFFLKL